MTDQKSIAARLRAGWRPPWLDEPLRPLEPVRVVPRRLAPAVYRYRLRRPEAGDRPAQP